MSMEKEKKEKIKKISIKVIHITTIVILVIMIGLDLSNVFLNVQKSHGTITPNIVGLAPIKVEEDIMQPDISTNDFLIISLANDIKEGDYITFITGTGKNQKCSTQKVVSVVKSSNGQYVSQYVVADAKGTQTNVTPSKVYGKVVINMKGFVPVVDFFNSLPGTSLLIALALILIFFPDLVSMFKREKEVEAEGEQKVSETDKKEQEKETTQEKSNAQQNDDVQDKKE